MQKLSAITKSNKQPLPRTTKKLSLPTRALRNSPKRKFTTTTKSSNLLHPKQIHTNQSSKYAMKVFNSELKKTHKETALLRHDAQDYSYLRSEIASRLVNRLSMIKMSFPHVTILGNDYGGLIPAITARHVNNAKNPYIAKKVENQFMLEQPPAFTPEGDEPMPTPEELNEALEHFKRAPIQDLKHITLVDASLSGLQRVDIENQKEQAQILPNQRFQLHLLPASLDSVPFLASSATTDENNALVDNSLPSNVKLVTELSNTTEGNPTTTVSHIIPHKTQLVLSNITMHWENDLPKVFKTAHNMLEPNGAFVGAIIGGESLRELRSSITLAEMERAGGVSHHISPFAYTKDIGDLLQKSGFDMISVDVDTLNIPYPDTFTLISHIQAMGESHAPHDPSRGINLDTWLAAAAIYDTLYRTEDNLLNCTIDVIMFIGWKGHDSLNKPAKRGSATAKIGEIVGKDKLQTTSIQNETPEQTPIPHAQPGVPLTSGQKLTDEEQIQGFFQQIRSENNGGCGKH